MYEAYPRTIRYRVYQSSIEEFKNLILDDIVDFRIDPSLMLNRWFKVFLHENFNRYKSGFLLNTQIFRNYDWKLVVTFQKCVFEMGGKSLSSTSGGMLLKEEYPPQYRHKIDQLLRLDVFGAFIVSRMHVSLVASVSRSTTGGREEEVIGIVGPGYAVLLRVVIPFRSSFGLVIVLPGRVPKPKDEASQLEVEGSRVDGPELGKPELDKLEVGFDLVSSLKELGPSLVVPLRIMVSLIPVLVMEVLILIVTVLILVEAWCIYVLGVANGGWTIGMRTTTSFTVRMLQFSYRKKKELDDSLRWAEVSQSLCSVLRVNGMAYNHTMEEMLQAPTEGYGDAIVVSDILAENFKIRTGLLSLIKANQFYGFESNNPHDHIRSFNRITSTLKFRDVPNDAIKLMLFSYSLEGAAKIWYEKEPPRSIFTWRDLVSKFVNHFFPPSKTTHLKNEITRFTQKFEETFGEAWERFKEILRQCPHHGILKLHQINTFYNVLNEHEQDSLNATAGGNILRKTPQDALVIIENKSKVRYLRNKSVAFKVSTTSSGNSSSMDARIDKLTDTISTLVETFNKKMTTLATVKAVEETCAICRGAHPYYDCIATDSNVSSVCATTGTYNHGYHPQVATNYHASPTGFPPVQNNQNRFNQNQNQSYNQNRGNNYQAPIQHPQVELTNELSKYKQNQINIVKNELRSDISNQTNELRNMMASYFQMNTASSSGFGSLPSNIVPNPRADLKAITTQSGVTLVGPSISPPLSTKVKENKEKDKIETKPDKNEKRGKARQLDECLALADMSASINLMSLSIWRKLSLPELTSTQMIFELADRSTTRPAGIAEDVFVKVGKFYFPTDFVVVDYVVDPCVPLILERPFLRTERALIDVYGEDLTLRVDDEAITFNVGQTLKCSYNNAESINQIDVIDVACEEYVQEVLGFSDTSKSGST
nr:reverse transcriptase domain-containing protein [Tanacetum cinerariifolium]